MNHWHTVDAAQILQHLGTDATHGLSSAEASRRLAEYGPNELRERELKSPWLIVWEQLTATMVVILIVAAAVSVALGDYKDAAAILAIVVINALLGVRQEYRTERAIVALKKLAVPTVKVCRDGHVQEISARDLVPGDIVLLEAGNLVPADGRLLESVNLRAQESALTGESEPVEKAPPALTITDLPLGDRHNMVYMGTMVTYGRGRVVVTETGMETELGALASMIQTVSREPTPLQRRLDQLGRGLAIAALTLVGIIFVTGLLRGESVRQMFLTAVSMAVAAVPEGLPAVVTMTLALGAQRMLKRRALIRKLPAVETLGSVTVICTDKTGTLTENRMTVTVLDVLGHRVDLTESIHPTDCGFSIVDSGLENDQSKIRNPQSVMGLSLLLAGGALCNDALLKAEEDAPGECDAIGDPTEGALVVAAARFGFRKAQMEQDLPRVAEVAFDSQRRRMTTVHHVRAGADVQVPGLARVIASRLGTESSSDLIFTKGAVDSLLEVSNRVWVQEQTEPLSAAWRQQILSAHDQLAQSGMRVLGVAFRPVRSAPINGQGDLLERDLIFVGMVGMIDPLRPEVKDAIVTCKTAGIRPVMITGDHPLTARYIARELGMAQETPILTSQDLERLSTEQLEESVEQVSIYARVSPEHKLKIVHALQNRGHVVAMTGDGVNDAPALKKADIGVAMGITGTDVSKEAADMVLQDDNFTTIVAAVEEGRVIYENIRKFIRYLLSCNSGELWVMLLAPFLGMPLPLLPLQILWMNLVTDGLPALALGVEPAERDIMRRPPVRRNEPIFGREMSRYILWVGLLIGLVSLGTGYWYWRTARANWQTMVFTTLTLLQIGNALAVRSGRDSLFRIGLLSNKPFLGAVVLTCVLQLSVVYAPFLQGFFKTVSLSAGDLLLSLALSTVVFWGVELEKWLIRRRAA